MQFNTFHNSCRYKILKSKEPQIYKALPEDSGFKAVKFYINGNGHWLLVAGYWLLVAGC